VILVFRRDADEICALLWFHVAQSGNSVPTFRDDLSVPSSRVNKSKHLQESNSSDKGTIGFPETSVRNYHSTLRNNSEERIYHTGNTDTVYKKQIRKLIRLAYGFTQEWHM